MSALVPPMAACTHGCWSCHAATTIPRPPCPAEGLAVRRARQDKRRAQAETRRTTTTEGTDR